MPNHKKPTALHVLNGNPSKIKDLGKGEPKPLSGIPDCPLWLDEVAREEWDRVAPALYKIGLLTEVDGWTLSNACQEYSDILKYRKVIAEDGATYEHTNVKGETNVVTRPEAILLYKAQQMLKAYCVELGLTPSARSRIQLPGEVDDNSEMEKLLNMKR
jgi:P27 family predicted phage terminase small subunit